MKTKSSELLEEKIELKATLDFVTNRNGELNEKLLESTTKLEKIESEKNEMMAPPPLASAHSFKMPDRQQQPNRSSDKENVMLPTKNFNPACGSIQTQQSQQVYQKNIRDQSNERFESRHSFKKKFDRARHKYAKKYGPLVIENGAHEMIIKDERDPKFQGKVLIMD